MAGALVRAAASRSRGDGGGGPGHRAFLSRRCSYMIDNVILLMNGALQKKAVRDMLGKCHPLGRFTEMEAVNVAETASDLFRAVLVETPLGACAARPAPRAVGPFAAPPRAQAVQPRSSPFPPQAGTDRPPARPLQSRLRRRRG